MLRPSSFLRAVSVHDVTVQMKPLALERSYIRPLSMFTSPSILLSPLNLLAATENYVF